MDAKENAETIKQENSNLKVENPAKGINDWNDRLDENLEPTDHNDVAADEKAEDFSKKFGSGDQSDDDGK
ncbi:hypothetical protein DHW03_06340 [Pedobacter yonginense]|uniref:Uncharacterized protein n=1 Tax=Pedobacter yonginense TaxID=651869 RepID=A0A317ERA4_9SPHI|nr:hypothetical protein [Pedobacter yonginense]PWS29430.1 hypothetical protein DHW03_06340 [Pedobacter yonginense]